MTKTKAPKQTGWRWHIGGWVGAQFIREMAFVLFVAHFLGIASIVYGVLDRGEIHPAMMISGGVAVECWLSVPRWVLEVPFGGVAALAHRDEHREIVAPLPISDHDNPLVQNTVKSMAILLDAGIPLTVSVLNPLQRAADDRMFTLTRPSAGRRPL